MPRLLPGADAEPGDSARGPPSDAALATLLAAFAASIPVDRRWIERPVITDP